ncbi:MAG TPA: hypothetical protein PKG52_13405 [bacterium]|nr:hypothetical protein [bacterium]
MRKTIFIQLALILFYFLTGCLYDFITVKSIIQSESLIHGVFSLLFLPSFILISFVTFYKNIKTEKVTTKILLVILSVFLNFMILFVLGVTAGLYFKLWIGGTI